MNLFNHTWYNFCNTQLTLDWQVIHFSGISQSDPSEQTLDWQVIHFSGIGQSDPSEQTLDWQDVTCHLTEHTGNIPSVTGIKLINL